jgi:hypothetical protein
MPRGKKRKHNNDDDIDFDAEFEPPVATAIQNIDPDWNKINSKESRRLVFQSPITHAPSYNGFTFMHEKDRIIPGVLPIMQECFCPYDSEVTNNIKEKKRRHLYKLYGLEPIENMKKRIREDGMIFQKTKNSSGGFSFGRYIDHQVKDLINQLGVNPKNSDLYPLSTTMDRKHYNVLSKYPWNLDHRKVELLHPAIRSILYTMTKLGYLPICGGLCVFSSELELGTEVDSIWMNVGTIDPDCEIDPSKMKLVICQLKTTKDITSFKKERGKLYPPYEDRACSYLNKAFLQLSLDTHCFTRTFKAHVHEKIVLVVDNNTLKVELFHLPDWVEKQWEYTKKRILDVSYAKKKAILQHRMKKAGSSSMYEVQLKTTTRRASDE